MKDIGEQELGLEEVNNTENISRCVCVEPADEPKQPLHQANGKGFNKNLKPMHQPTNANTLMVQAIQPISTDRGWICSRCYARMPNLRRSV